VLLNIHAGREFEIAHDPSRTEGFIATGTTRPLPFSLLCGGGRFTIISVAGFAVWARGK